MTSRLANDIIIIPVLPKNPVWKIVRIRQPQEFLNQTTGCADIAYCLAGYVILSHPVCQVINMYVCHISVIIEALTEWSLFMTWQVPSHSTMWRDGCMRSIRIVTPSAECSVCLAFFTYCLFEKNIHLHISQFICHATSVSQRNTKH